MMKHKDSAVLYVPAGEDDYGTIWRQYVLTGVTFEVTESLAGDTGVMYIFDSTVKVTCDGVTAEIPVITPGCAVQIGECGKSDGEFSWKLPIENIFKIISVERYSRGSAVMHHIKLTLS